MKVDIEGNPHFVIQVLPCESTEEGFCWYTEEAGLYHFKGDRDCLVNTTGDGAECWTWAFAMRGDATWSFADLTGETYIWNNSSSLASGTSKFPHQELLKRIHLIDIGS